MSTDFFTWAVDLSNETVFLWNSHEKIFMFVVVMSQNMQKGYEYLFFFTFLPSWTKAVYLWSIAQELCNHCDSYLWLLMYVSSRVRVCLHIATNWLVNMPIAKFTMLISQACQTVNLKEGSLSNCHAVISYNIFIQYIFSQNIQHKWT